MNNFNINNVQSLDNALIFHLQDLKSYESVKSDSSLKQKVEKEVNFIKNYLPLCKHNDTLVYEFLIELEDLSDRITKEDTKDELLKSIKYIFDRINTQAKVKNRELKESVNKFSTLLVDKLGSTTLAEQLNNIDFSKDTIMLYENLKSSWKVKIIYLY